MSDKLIVLLTIVIGCLSTGLSQPTATTERITSDGCGSTKVCAREAGCKPAGNVLCPFASLQVINNSSLDVAFELFGNSSGYIGMVLESDVIQGGNAAFVCSRDPVDRNFIFRTAVLSTLPTFDSDKIFKPEVDSVKYNFNGSINSNFRQCSFTARRLRKFIKMTASENIPVQLSIISGEVTGFGTFQTPSAKLLDKTIHIPVAADCSILKHPLPQAIVMLVCAFAVHLF